MIDREQTVLDYSPALAKETCERTELYRLLEEGIEAENAGHARSYREAIMDIRKEINK